MDKQTTNKVLIIAVIFLAVLNIATIASIFYHINKIQKMQAEQWIARKDLDYYSVCKPGKSNAYKFHQRHFGAKPSNGKNPSDYSASRQFNRMIEELNLSPEQKEYFFSTKRAFFAKHHVLLDSLRYYHRKIDSLACMPTSDKTQLEYYSKKIANLHYRFTMNYAYLLNDWYRHCTASQRRIFCRIITCRYRLPRRKR